MKKIVLMLALTTLAGCATMQSTRVPENKTTVNLNIKYQEAYRLITQSLLNDCGLPSKVIHPVIYPDINMASITQEEANIVGWSIELTQRSETETTLDFYTTFAAQKKYLTRIQEHLNGKLPGCYLDAIN